MLLGLNGLRVSEACATNIGHLGSDRGHRTLRIIGKGNKPAVIPLVPRTARTIDLAVGERRDGAILVRHDGERLDRRTARRWVRSIGKRAGLGAVHPHMLRAAFIMAALDAGVPLRDVQLGLDMPTRAPQRSMTGAARTSTDTPPTSSSPSWPEPDNGVDTREQGEQETSVLENAPKRKLLRSRNHAECSTFRRANAAERNFRARAIVCATPGFWTTSTGHGSEPPPPSGILRPGVPSRHRACERGSQR